LQIFTIYDYLQKFENRINDFWTECQVYNTKERIGIVKQKTKVIMQQAIR